jgi:hypothetical protein
VKLKSLALELAEAGKTPGLTVEIAGKRIDVTQDVTARRMMIRFPQAVVLAAGGSIEIRIR